MVEFGKKLKQCQYPEWEWYYINYKLMKKKVRYYAQQVREDKVDRRHVLKEMSTMLDKQIEKTVLFLLKQQGHLASRLEALGEEHELLKKYNNLAGMQELRESYTAVSQDLLKLLYFIEINAIGLRKILKKFDKRVGYQFTNYYVSSRSNHPYSQLRQVFKHVGLEAVVGALSHNLVELQHGQKSYLSIYDQPEGMHVPQDPVIETIKSAVERLTNSTNFLTYVGKHALIIQEELPSPLVEHAEEQELQDYDVMSLTLNLANTFLYMVNTYIIVPTADDYAVSLGASATICGVIIGCMPMSQLVSSIYLSAWSNKSYFRPLVFSSIVLSLGNILYATAYNLDSLYVLFLGRLLCGAGSARAVNRRYISDCVPSRKRLQSSAYFVIASALGMSCGPAFAGLLQFKKSLMGLTLDQNTLPGWVMCVLWIFYLLWLWVSFKEPLRMDDSENSSQDGSNGSVREGTIDESLTEPLTLEPKEHIQDEEGTSDEIGRNGTNDKSHKAAKSFFEAYKLVSRPVKVMLLIYLTLKFITEMVISESSVITTYYFSWTTTTVAIFLALLGLTVLPVNLILGNYVGNMFEDRQLLISSQILTCIGVLISFKLPIHYSVAQYVTGSFVTFVSAEVLEGVNLSLLSKLMSSRLSRGTYNGGLLSTQAGTLGRVLADLTITFVGYLGTKYLLDITLAPALLLGAVSIVVTCFSYNTLF